MWKGYYLLIEGKRKGYLFRERKVYIRVGVWTFGGESPRINICRVTSPPSLPHLFGGADHGEAIQAKIRYSILRVFQVVVTWSPQAQTILILDIHVMVNSQPYLGRYPPELRSWYRLNLSIIFIWALSSVNAKSIWSRHRHLTCGGGLSDFRNKCPAKKSWNEQC